MEQKRSHSDEELGRSAIHLLHRAGQCASEIFSAEVADRGLTPRQYVVLLVVSQEEGLSQTDLVARTGIDRSTLADIVRRMLKKGLLSRRRTRADARIYSVRLTNPGREALQAARPAAEQAEARLLSGLDPMRRNAFMESLEQIVRAADDAGSH